MSNSTLKILPALIVAIITSSFAHPASAGPAAPTPTPVVTFTEINDTTLTAVYTNGSGFSTPLTVTPQGADQWDVTLSGNLSNPGTAGNGWIEPDSTAVNQLFPFFGSGWTVISDETFTGPGQFANNQITSSPIATDNTISTAPVSVFGVFNDLRDTATVPDTGTTASLFGLSLTGLAFFRRKLC